jgi:hypothetical protein
MNFLRSLRRKSIGSQSIDHTLIITSNVLVCIVSNGLGQQQGVIGWENYFMGNGLCSNWLSVRVALQPKKAENKPIILISPYGQGAAYLLLLILLTIFFGFIPQWCSCSSDGMISYGFRRHVGEPPYRGYWRSQHHMYGINISGLDSQLVHLRYIGLHCSKMRSSIRTSISCKFISGILISVYMLPDLELMQVCQTVCEFISVPILILSRLDTFGTFIAVVNIKGN